jgi:thiol:disulfide interchange protein
MILATRIGEKTRKKLMNTRMKAMILPVPVLFLLLAGPLSAQSARSAHVDARLVAEPGSIQPGKAFTAALFLSIDPGWYIYGNRPGDTGLPTTLQLELPAGFESGTPRWPAVQDIKTRSGETAHGYAGELFLLVDLKAAPTLPAGVPVTLKARAAWLACSVECMPGRVELSLSLPVSSSPPSPDPAWSERFAAARAAPSADAGMAAGAGAAGLLAAIGLALLGGLILNLMPCVLPVISLKVLALGREGKGLRDGALYTLGVLVTFWLVAGILLLMRAAGRELGWGFQLQSPAVAALAALLFFLIGLNLLGVFEVGASLTRLGGARTGAGSGLGSFLTGALATVVATPCTAPFMGVAIGYALANPPGMAMAVFTGLGLGMAAPMLVLSAAPRLLHRMPKPGPWMQTLRQALGLVMMAAVLWMLFVLAGLSGAQGLIACLAGMLAAAVGAWTWGRWGGLERRRGVRVAAGVAAGLVVLASAAGSVWGAARGSAAAAPAARGSPSDSERGAFWEPWSQDRVDDLRAQGVPVFVDFTARWCLSCQVNERAALDAPVVRARMRALGVAALKADWTGRDEAIAAGLAGFGRASVPLYVYYPKGGGAPVILPELLTPGIVLRALEGGS